MKKSAVSSKSSKKIASEYAVMLDQHGVRYLKVGGSTRDVLLILDSGKAVDLIKMDNSTVHSRDLRPVPNGSILEAARALFKPSRVDVKIDPRAAEILQRILHDKELIAMARVAVAASKKTTPATEVPASAKRAVAVAAAPKKGAKPAAAPAKAAKKAAAPAATNGTGRARLAGQKIRVLNREHGAREGTKRAQAMELLFKCKTTDDAIPKLAAIGADNSFISFAVAHGLIELA